MRVNRSSVTHSARVITAGITIVQAPFAAIDTESHINDAHHPPGNSGAQRRC